MSPDIWLILPTSRVHRRCSLLEEWWKKGDSWTGLSVCVSTCRNGPYLCFLVCWGSLRCETDWVRKCVFAYGCVYVCVCVRVYVCVCVHVCVSMCVCVWPNPWGSAISTLVIKCKMLCHWITALADANAIHIQWMHTFASTHRQWKGKRERETETDVGRQTDP